MDLLTLFLNTPLATNISSETKSYSFLLSDKSGRLKTSSTGLYLYGHESLEYRLNKWVMTKLVSSIRKNRKTAIAEAYPISNLTVPTSSM